MSMLLLHLLLLLLLCAHAPGGLCGQVRPLLLHRWRGQSAEGGRQEDLRGRVSGMTRGA